MYLPHQVYNLPAWRKYHLYTYPSYHNNNYHNNYHNYYKYPTNHIKTIIAT